MAKYLKKTDWGEHWAEIDITKAMLVRRSFETLAKLGFRLASDDESHGSHHLRSGPGDNIQRNLRE